MKRKKANCDPTLLNKFFDGELPEETHTRISEHLRNCVACQEMLRENEAISSLFKKGMKDELSQIDLGAMERKILEKIPEEKLSLFARLKDVSTTMRFLVPSAAIAGILIFFFATIRTPSPNSTPSAIINSFTGDVSSVMIIETPLSHQTIIWINET